jgi:glucosamine--fructose-6-phosphate aminotransferase (isomerizing)
MCGIFGILTISNNINIYKIIIDGLIQLQNRGYDSSGISVLKNSEFETYKYASTSQLSSIDKLLQLNLEIDTNSNINIGIGHNRWATHGPKNDINAHPHISNNKKFILVHNGIIENYIELKNMLIEKGFTFYSQTDTEVIVNLISYYYQLFNDTFISIEKSINDMQGTYGIIIMNKDEPHKIYCVRNGSPLLVGYNDDYAIITSEQSGFCNLVNTYMILNNDDICVIEKSDNMKINIQTTHTYIHKEINISNFDLSPLPYKHWTIKEINEQPNTIYNSINRGGRIKSSCSVKLGGLEQNIDILSDINNLILLGCGTSYNAGLYGMYYLKNLCNFNTAQVFDGAEFMEYDIPKIGKTAFILISQSGETKDLHRCIEIAKNNNIITIGIINVVDSLIAREVDCGVYCNAGREIGVASTKAFTSQVVCLSLVAIWFSQIAGINEIKRKKMIKDLQNLSNDFKNTINSLSNKIEELSSTYINYNNLFLLGKGTDESIAREGSLKIKEISYIHSEAYSASSLKHGPFALLDYNFPVIILNCHEEHENKIKNCFEEVHSRNSPILFITNNDNIKLNNINDENMIYVIKNSSYSSLLGLIPLQLLAYNLSINRNINPDIPKNLAKVVTVE